VNHAEARALHAFDDGGRRRRTGGANLAVFKAMARSFVKN
jgi:hypothetical protein